MQKSGSISRAMAVPLKELTVKLDEPVFVKLADQPGCEINTSPFFLTNIDQVYNSQSFSFTS